MIPQTNANRTFVEKHSKAASGSGILYYTKQVHHNGVECTYTNNFNSCTRYQNDHLANKTKNLPMLFPATSPHRSRYRKSSTRKRSFRNICKLRREQLVTRVSGVFTSYLSRMPTLHVRKNDSSKFRAFSTPTRKGGAKNIRVNNRSRESL